MIDLFASDVLRGHPTPWRFEMVPNDCPCPDCGEERCGYTDEPVIYSANGEEILDLRVLKDGRADIGPSGRIAFAETIVSLVNVAYSIVGTGPLA